MLALRRGQPLFGRGVFQFRRAGVGRHRRDLQARGHAEVGELDRFIGQDHDGLGFHAAVQDATG
ncbi:MAG TPA: hypothetical protein VMT79_02650, partial [Candidatus Binatia bacterium]|nr:hypothetical protein [Candidatus Binatia bacterium]